MRIAWFSPMPPVRSGVADCSAELIPRLRARFGIDVFADTPAAGEPGRRSAHDFVWLHQQRPYDLVVYQLGNSAHHAYEWPYLFRYPGLVVLHDVHLHHARAASLLQAGRTDDYRTEFRWNQPDASPDLAELAIAGFDNHLYYAWPMTRLVVQASRLIAVHGDRLRALVSGDYPDARIETVRLGHGQPITAEQEREARKRVSMRHAIPAGAVVFGCFGTLAPEKRVPAILAAFARTRAHVPDVHLLLAGGVAPHYNLQADIARHGLADAITVTGYLASDEDLTSHIAACDVALNLRWPTAREISGPWLRCLAAGKATVITHLRHLTDIPALDPRTWEPYGSVGPRAGGGAVCVAIDLLDEDHSLRLATRRLAEDGALRRTLEAAGHAYWAAEHSIERMVSDYGRLIPLAASIPPPQVALPAHLVEDGGGRLIEILQQFELGSPLR
jgi:glycosyltransferase involved in cell wall biosynthesis